MSDHNKRAPITIEQWNIVGARIKNKWWGNPNWWTQTDELELDVHCYVSDRGGGLYALLTELLLYYL